MNARDIKLGIYGGLVGGSLSLKKCRVRRHPPMINKNASKIVIFLIAFGLTAPINGWAGARRGHASLGHHGHRGHHGYHGRLGYHGAYGHGYHGYPSHYRYGNHYYPRFYGPNGGPYQAVGPLEYLGALDLNVKPKNTQIYLNGRYIGVTDNFDGIPRYLWLEEGTHEVIFYNEGYKTVLHEFIIRPGAVMKIKQRLQRGDSLPPEELSAKALVDDKGVKNET